MAKWRSTAYSGSTLTSASTRSARVCGMSRSASSIAHESRKAAPTIATPASGVATSGARPRPSRSDRQHPRHRHGERRDRARARRGCAAGLGALRRSRQRRAERRARSARGTARASMRRLCVPCCGDLERAEQAARCGAASRAGARARSPCRKAGAVGVAAAGRIDHALGRAPAGISTRVVAAPQRRALLAARHDHGAHAPHDVVARRGRCATG